jgi:hypothetical protein
MLDRMVVLLADHGANDPALRSNLSSGGTRTGQPQLLH